MSEAEDQLRSYCQKIERRGAERVVARWIDETRPVDEPNNEGVTIGPVQRVTVKTAIEGEIVDRTFEGLDYRTIREILESHDFETLFRSDNLTRRDTF